MSRLIINSPNVRNGINMEISFEKVKKLFSESDNFALFLNENPKNYEIFARTALFLALKNNNLNASLLPPNPKWLNKEWGHILNMHQSSETNGTITSILIPKKHYNVAEINYEEKENFFCLNIKSDDILKREDLILEEKKKIFGAVFFFGEKNQKNIEKIREETGIDSEENIIFITTDGNETLPQKTSKIIEAVKTGEKLSKSVSTFLFLSLLDETGAEKEKPESISFINLFGRAAARTRTNKQIETTWSFISEEDLEKTGNIEADNEIFCKIIEKCQKISSAPQTAILLWQQRNIVRAIIFDKDPQTLLLIAKELDAQKITERENYILAGPFNNFSETEIKINEILKRTKNFLQ